MIIMISSIICWLVVWNTAFIFPFSWEFHHPNWSEVMFFRGVGQPPSSLDMTAMTAPSRWIEVEGFIFEMVIQQPKVGVTVEILAEQFLGCSEFG